VYYGAAPSEAATYAGGHVYIVGAANSAGQAAVMFSRHAAHVTMIVRGESLQEKMSQYLVDQIGATPNIEVLLNTRVVKVAGETVVEKVRLLDTAANTETEHKASAIFIFVGAVPHSDFVSDLVAIDGSGFILTGADTLADEPARWTLDRDPYLQETSVPGIFAAGDVRAGVVRRVASAVGQGSVAISMIHKYLETV
jgi:thioredoxin reductase (NADPH)